MIEYEPIKKCIITKDKFQETIPKNCCINTTTFERLKQYAANGQVFQIDVSTGEEDTAKDFLSRCIRMAHFMKEVGLKEGDIISTCTDNHFNTYVPILAAHFIGCVIASTGPFQTLEETKHLMNLVKPKMYFVSKGFEEMIRKCIETLELTCQMVTFDPFDDLLNFDQIMTQYKDINEDDFVPVRTYTYKEDRFATFFFTSGTTGLPKAAPNSLRMFRTSHDWNKPPQPGVRILGVGTPYHFSSMAILYSGCFYGYTICVANYDSKTYWDTLRKYRVNVAFLNYAQLAEVLQYLQEPVNDLKHFTITGGQIPHEFTEKLRSILNNCIIENPYGTTEIDYITVGTTSFKDHAVGLPVLNGQIIKVVNPDTHEALSFNELGEIRVKSSYQFAGYYNNDSRECWDSEGFFKTGDLGYYDKHFEFFILDRIKDVFKYKSFHVSPIIIEKAVSSHDDVSLAIAFGFPHPIDGNHAMVIVVLKENATVTEKELVKFANEKLSETTKIRAGIKFVPSTFLPVTATGKIKRYVLKNLIISNDEAIHPVHSKL